MLEVKSICRHYGDLKAVDNVSFSIAPGEVVGLLGHNGAGKTTIMKMLSGYLEPDSGEIRFQGQEIQLGDKNLQRSLGYLPENLPIYPELSVASYLQYAAELKGITGKAQRSAIRSVVEATDLVDRFISPIATLSRGMKQRVGVAQALLGNPSLLILDEPTNGLDPSQTEQMRALIKSISESATVILSTHIMQEVEAMCGRALIIRQGELAADTTLNEMQTQQRISLHSSSSEQAIVDTIGQQSWFSSISTASSQTVVPGTNAFSINVSPTHDAHTAVELCAVELVNRSIPIAAIQIERQDLQSLFLEINASGSASTHSSENTQEVSHVA